MADLFNFRCPDDLRVLIEERSKQTGENRSKIVTDALRYAFGLDATPSDAVVGQHTLTRLEGEIERLKKQLKALNNAVMS